MIIPTQDTTRTYRPTPLVPIEEYARYVSYDEGSVLGVRNAPNATHYECRDVWSLDQRNYIMHYLSEAQEEIEDQIGYFLVADWVVGQLSDERDYLERYVDTQVPEWPINSYKRMGTYKARWKHIVKVGVRAVEDIALLESVSHVTDPAVIGPVATTVTDVNEIRVYHPNSDLEINPSEIVISGGMMTISIPRVRMVLESQQDNPAQGWDYNDLTNFESEVDIKRVYTDETGSQAVLHCTNCGTCDNRLISGCIRVLSAPMGTLDIRSNNLGCSCGCTPEKIGFYYYAGNVTNTQKAKDMVIRLAHSKMPDEPCGCAIAQRLWERDRKTAEIVTPEMTNNPFGINNGAIVAWQWVKASKVFSFGEL